MTENIGSTSNLDTLFRLPASTSLGATTILQITSKLPFVSIPGTFNTRDLGVPLPLSLCSANDLRVTNRFIRQGYAYRTGSLENLSEEGRTAISKLGIKVIFDLRSAKEREKHPDPDLPGVENVWKDSDKAQAEQSRRNQTSERDKISQSEDVPLAPFADMYIDMLQTHKPGIRSVFEHIHRHADQPFLFHCTAGKDRTGLIAALILAVVNAPLKYIDLEYALSRIGIDEVRPMLIRKMTGDRDVPVTELSGRHQLYAEVKLDAMTPVLEHVNKEYGGIDGYLRSQLGLSEEDVETIRANLSQQNT